MTYWNTKTKFSLQGVEIADDSIIEISGHKYLKIGDKYIPVFESLNQVQKHIESSKGKH